MSCGYQLRWFDLIPIISWIALRGKCRCCKAKLSPQYPIIEAANGLLWVICFLVKDLTVEALILCFSISALLALSIIDERTREIPFGFNVFLFAMGVLMTLYDSTWAERPFDCFYLPAFLYHIIGMLCVSLVLWLLYQFSGGRAIGGGDVKLMFSAGLLLGWPKIILAFVIGCVAGAIIHVIRMKVAGAEKVLAMGPYLAAGIFIAALFGQQIISAYLNILH